MADNITEYTLHDMLSGTQSFPPGDRRIRQRIMNCPDISFMYQKESMMQPAAYSLCVMFNDTQQKPLTKMSGIRKKTALRPFTDAVVIHRPDPQMAQMVASGAAVPVVLMAMETQYFYSVAIKQFRVINGIIEMIVQCDKKIVQKPFAYDGSDMFALNGIDPMVLEKCGGNGVGAFDSFDDNDGNPVGVHFTDLSYHWRR
jgi:hypothetical protein